MEDGIATTDEKIEWLAELLDEDPCPLSVREQEFIADMSENVSEFWHATEKQEAWIDRLYEKHIEG